VSYGLSLGQVFDAVEQNNSNAGGGYIERGGDQYVIRAEGLIANPHDIENIIVATRGDGTPIQIRDLGSVIAAPMIRQGAATRDGRGDVVTGVVMMLIGENSRLVAQHVRQKLQDIQKTLPPGVTIDTYYDRTELVNRTIKTVSKNLTEGAILVIAVLLLILGNLRAGLIVAAAIPLSMLVAFTGMVYAGLSGNLMSLGAIDFGLIVDGSVVMIEDIMRHISELRRRDDRALSDADMIDLVRAAGGEALRPIFFCGRNHYRRLPADPHASRRGGKDVPPDGAYGGVRVVGGAGPLLHVDAGAGELAASPQRCREGNPIH